MARTIAPELDALAFLLGTWRGRGDGEYPTIEPFSYVEEAVFGHVGKPFISYAQKTRHAVTDQPLHSEAGYLRPVGADAVELVVVQPSGIVEIHEGTVEGTTIRFVSTAVLTTPTAKECRSVERTLDVDGGVLGYELAMAAVGQPLRHHLRAELRRVEE